MAHLTYDDLCLLHGTLRTQFQKHDLEVHAVMGCDSATDHFEGQRSIAYLRPLSDARTVEMMMGRDVRNGQIDLKRHPVIELRISEPYLVLELVVPPTAWWDQQNLVGKSLVERHRHQFRRMISHMDADFRFGSWVGSQLDSLTLAPNQIVHPAVFEPWLSTFSHGQDWFRVGVWYDNVPQDITLLTHELFKHFQILHQLYAFIAWTGSNDYRAFYNRASLSTYAS